MVDYNELIHKLAKVFKILPIDTSVEADSAIDENALDDLDKKIDTVKDVTDGLVIPSLEQIEASITDTYSANINDVITAWITDNLVDILDINNVFDFQYLLESILPNIVASLDNQALADIYVATVNKSLPLYQDGSQYKMMPVDGRFKLVLYNPHSTSFTIEYLIYLVLRKLRTHLVNAFTAVLDFTNDILPNEIDFYIPLFSSVGIHIASKVNNVWVPDFTEWPNTTDPEVFHLYFQLPDLPGLEFLTISIPNFDISKNNVPFFSNNAWSTVRKYTLKDMIIDAIGFSITILIGYIITRMGFNHVADNFAKQATNTAASIQVSSNYSTVVNNVYFNKAVAANLTCSISLINALLGTAANVALLNDILASAGLNPITNIMVNKDVEVSEKLDAIKAVTDDLDIKDTSLDIDDIKTDVSSVSDDTADIKSQVSKLYRGCYT